MRGASGRYAVGTLLLAAGVGFASCREPTQIKLELRTDAECPEGDTRPRLNDVVILTAKQIELGTPGNPKPAPPVNAETELCSGSGEYRTIGSLVLLPDGSENPAVDVLVAAGVQRDATDDTANSMTAGQCAALAFEGSSIEGLPCIIARRRLTFVDHNALLLPIDLDKACIGEDCGADLTCYRGNCVSPDISCPPDQPGCTPPASCAQECEEICPSGNGACVEGECECAPCDAAECAGKPCELGSVGVCGDDGSCGCVAACDPDACAAMGGTCQGPYCLSEDCSADNCSGSCGTNGAGTWQCVDVGAGELDCACITEAPCDETQCSTRMCTVDGEEPSCQQLPDGEACVCSCDDDACAIDCASGCGSCVDGLCGCSAACTTASCGVCARGEVPQCADPCGGCDCACQDGECQTDCVGDGYLGGTCDNNGACQCVTGNGSGGMGGFTSAGGGGFTSGSGGAGTPTGGGGAGPGVCSPPVPPTCPGMGEVAFCNPVNDQWECRCDENACDLAQGSTCAASGLLSTCYGAPPTDMCVCYCDTAACDNHCMAGQTGTCQGTIGGTCMCGGADPCPDTTAGDCNMCDAACAGLNPMCTGGVCADVGMPPVNCQCILQ